jgi:peptide/nickel transport system ATP-binding protein
MTTSLLRVNSLRTWFGHGENPYRAVDGIDFEIARGQTVALLGESGCGKSISALSIMRLNPHPASRIVSGEVWLDDVNLLNLSEADMEKIRGRRISMIFQEPQSSLNPVLTVGQQIAEVLKWHFDLSESAIVERTLSLLNAVGIPAPEQRIHAYPHELSGGMKQRVMIAIALAGEPELLIADEPTTALDVTIQAQILSLLKQIQQQTGMSILLITHDLGVVAQMADHIAVMYAGEIVESASREQFFAEAKHPYTKKLFAALPSEQKREQKLTMIRGTVPPLNQQFAGCRFVERCDLAQAHCHDNLPVWQSEAGHGVRCHLYDAHLAVTADAKKLATVTAKLSDVVPAETAVLAVDNLKVHFPIKKGLFQRTVGQVKAVDGLHFELHAAETVALVGESGCGKTTVGKAILHLLTPTAGQISYLGKPLAPHSGKSIKAIRSAMQIIFQDPFSSMNPRMTINQVIQEGMQSHHIGREEKNNRVDALLERVGLRPELKHRYPHEFSGGQRQRICIARALAAEPKVIICDEPTSALDVSVQAQVLNLLRDIQHEFGLSYVFITHNIAVVDYLAHRVAVMYLGRIVEQGLREEVLNSPKHPYTQALLAAVPSLDVNTQYIPVAVEGELPSPANPPQGCHFHKRCAHAMPVCETRYPQETVLTESHRVNCFLFNEETDGNITTN